MDLRLKKEILTKSKYPVGMKKHVGIEIEFFSKKNKEKLKDILCQLDLHSNCHLVDDHSLNIYIDKPKFEHEKITMIDDFGSYNSCTLYCKGCSNELKWKNENPLKNHNSHELRILVSENELSFILKKVKQFLKLAEAKVNKSCGLHVHLDMRQRDFKTCVKNFLNKQKEMHKMVDKTRLKNKFCKKLTKKQFQNGTYDRYKDININAYKKLGTLEIRLHEGTVNVIDILNWTKYLISIADNKTVDKRYVEKRIKKCS